MVSDDERKKIRDAAKKARERSKRDQPKGIFGEFNKPKEKKESVDPILGGILNSIPDKTENRKLKENDTNNSVSSPPGDGNFSNGGSSGDRPHCPQCQNVLEKGIDGNFKCKICGWDAKKVSGGGPSKAHVLDAKAAKYTTIGLVSIGGISGSIFLVTSGLLSILSTAVLIGSVLAFFLGHYAHNHGLGFTGSIVKWSGGLSILMTLFFSLNLFSLGPVAGIVNTLGFEGETSADLVAGIWDRIKEPVKDFSCILKTTTSPDDIPDECLEEKVCRDCNDQTYSSSIKLEQFEVGNNKRMSVGGSNILVLKLRNNAEDAINVNIGLEKPSEKFIMQVPNGCNSNTETNCNTFITSGIPWPITWQYEATDDIETGDYEFKVNVTYDSNLESSLTVKTTDDIKQRATLGTVPSKTSAGSANLILSAENQPLYAGDPFLFYFKIVNNQDGGGHIKKSNATVLIPSGIVEYPDSDKCAGPYNVDIIPQVQCEIITGLSNYFCLNVNINEKIENQEEFLCNFEVKSDANRELTRTVIGKMDYTYGLTSTAKVRVE